MMSEEIKNQVRRLIADHLEEDLESVTDEKDLVDDLGADSIDLYEMVMLTEDQLEIIIDDEKLEDIDTVGQFIGVVVEADVE